LNRIRNRLTLSGIVLAYFIIILGFFIANHESNIVGAYPSDAQRGDYRFGTISSIQNDENGIPAWVLMGHWKSNLADNQSSIANQTNLISRTGSFDAQFEMVLLNGSADHTHTITNFIATNSSQINNSTMMFNGTSTASLRAGPVTDIPTSITIMGDKVISIWLDPSRVDNHYGNTPIYGLVMDRDQGRQGSMKLNSTQLG
jgi:hypothetical protein